MKKNKLDKKTNDQKTKQKPAVKEEQKIKEEPKKEPKAEAATMPPTIQAQAQDAAQQAVKAERERVAQIQSICAGDFPKIEREAISAGWIPETVTSKVLATIRAERPSADVHITVKSKPEGEGMRKTLEAAMCLRVGVDADSLGKSIGAQAVEAGMGEMDMPLRQLLIECMRLDGIPASRGFDNDTIRAAFSSVSLPGILSNVANKKLLQSCKRHN